MSLRATMITLEKADRKSMTRPHRSVNKDALDTPSVAMIWVHHNLVVMNTRAGIRDENSPSGLADGVHASEPTALIEHNEVHGNSIGAGEAPRPISIRNAQNALVRQNVFGETTIDGVVYPSNFQNVAVTASDSGKKTRTDLWNVDIVDNVLNGETIRGCQLPDEVVYCANNSR